MDYIPATGADFIDWPANLITVGEAHAADCKLSPAALTELRTLHTEMQ
ncbi:hypothetical protein FACS1894200_07870 [Spirochaetia bacterium]|nr:hypothetical protein FACS1894200_07870 [Spirochaetia bacterium]